MSKQLIPCKSILLIDDEIEILNGLQRSLKELSSSILTADNGRMGLEMARKHQPSVIISDFFMPTLNGLELLKSLNEEGFKIPMIWLTGYAKGDLQKQAWMSGVYDVIEKPFDIDRLRQSVSGAVNWYPSQKGTVVPNLITKLVSREIHLSVDARKYFDLVRLCESQNISITSFLNQLIDHELNKSA